MVNPKSIQIRAVKTKQPTASILEYDGPTRSHTGAALKLVKSILKISSDFNKFI